MYEIGNYIVYKHDVCIIKNVTDLYYVISPIDDESLVINTPIGNKFIRSVMSLSDALKLIEQIPKIPLLDNIDDKHIENKYKELLNENTHENLVKIIKTSYIRNQNRISNNKKISEKDSTFFNLAEKYLYNELSISLDKSVEDVKLLIQEACIK